MNLTNKLKQQLSDSGFNPENVVDIISINNKQKRTITTKFKFNDGSEHEIVENFIYYAARKNKKW